MKKFIITLFFIMLMALPVHAATVISVPIDGRPISDEYLGNIVKAGGDKYISVSKENMDFFSSYEPDNHIGNSAAVREELYKLVSANNSEYTTVIINSSSYFTNGLVGGRCGSNYDDTIQALKDLHKLVTDFPKPKYYVNISMPRALPETRLNQIWPNDEKMHGLAWYYLNENKDCEDYGDISLKYAEVTPAQYIMEFSYVESKAAELGEDKLTSWERAFLNYFNTNIKNREPYKKYVEYYKRPYSMTASIFTSVLSWHKSGDIDEIIVSNDDLQIPDSISYFASKGADWVQLKNGSPVKYSYARQYMETLPASIQNVFASKYDKKELGRALAGRGKSVNIVYGTDEIPQLIYARDYASRKNMTADIKLTYNDVTQNVATFDVLQPGNIARTACNFVRGSVGNFAPNAFNMYVYDYRKEGSANAVVAKLEKLWEKGSDIGLIELFNGTGDNAVFKTLMSRKELSRLSAYSAWNTNANAIGLGIAQAQVLTIAKQCTNSPTTACEAAVNVLVQHMLEDGIYTKSGKLALVNKGYRPNVQDRTHSKMLYDMLNIDKIRANIVGAEYTFKGEKYTVEDMAVTKTSFPWGRTFDIYVEIDSDVKKISR